MCWCFRTTRGARRPRSVFPGSWTTMSTQSPKSCTSATAGQCKIQQSLWIGTSSSPSPRFTVFLSSSPCPVAQPLSLDLALRKHASRENGLVVVGHDAKHSSPADDFALLNVFMWVSANPLASFCSSVTYLTFAFWLTFSAAQA